MPLDSYEQFWTVSEIYTDKGIYQYLQQFFHMWARGGDTLLRVTVMIEGVWSDGEQLSVNCVHCVCMFYLLKVEKKQETRWF